MSGESLKGEIFLNTSAVGHPGPETPLDVFNDGDAFFPLLLENGETRIIATSRVADISWDSDESIDEDRAAVARSTSLEVRLMNGATYKGTMLIEVPLRHSRIMDFLNFHSKRFLTISSDGKSISINREMVESVRPLD